MVGWDLMGTGLENYRKNNQYLEEFESVGFSCKLKKGYFSKICEN